MTAFLYSFDGSLHCIDVDNAAIGTGACLKKFVSRIYEVSRRVQSEILGLNKEFQNQSRRFQPIPGCSAVALTKS